MRKKLTVIIRCVCFALLFTLALLRVSEIVERKTTVGPWNHTIKINGFYNEEASSFDVMFFGSSHAYCAFNPLTLWKQRGITSYTLTSQQQYIGITYYYIREALKTQSPEVVVIEAYMLAKHAAETDEAVYHQALDYLPPSLNKAELIFDIIPPEEQKNFFFNFLKYHSRWDSLTENDFDTAYLDKRDPTLGYVYLTTAGESELDSSVADITERESMPEEQLGYLDKIIALSEEYGFKLVLTAAPYNAAADMPSYNYLADYARSKNVDFINFNLMYDELGLDAGADFYDYGHTNCYGAEKISRYTADYLADKYGVRDRRGETGTESFDERAEAFYRDMDSIDN